MERFSTCDIREKEVINLCDGTRLGCPRDFEINACDGKITAIILEGQGGFLGFGQSKEIIIPWCKIECIGEDAILVKLTREDLDRHDERGKKKKKSLW